MKAFRGQPSIFTSSRQDEKRAELEVKNLTKGDEFIIEIPNPLAKMVCLGKYSFINS